MPLQGRLHEWTFMLSVAVSAQFGISKAYSLQTATHSLPVFRVRFFHVPMHYLMENPYLYEKAARCSRSVTIVFDDCWTFGLFCYVQVPPEQNVLLGLHCSAKVTCVYGAMLYFCSICTMDLTGVRTVFNRARGVSRWISCTVCQVVIALSGMCFLKWCLSRIMYLRCRTLFFCIILHSADVIIFWPRQKLSFFWPYLSFHVSMLCSIFFT